MEFGFICDIKNATDTRVVIYLMLKQTKRLVTNAIVPGLSPPFTVMKYG